MNKNNIAAESSLKPNYEHIKNIHNTFSNSIRKLKCFKFGITEFIS